jgi:hypothetical protein
MPPLRRFRHAPCGVACSGPGAAGWPLSPPAPPCAGAGGCSAAQGGVPAALRALAGDLVSGTLLDGRGGAPAPTDRAPAQGGQPRRCSPR